VSRAARGVGDDELRSDTARLAEERRPLGRLQMSVEVAGEDALEGVARGACRRARPSMASLWSRPTTSPGSRRVRKPVPQATSRVRAGGSFTSRSSRSASSDRNCSRSSSA
jgi:hypothetical protein